MKKIVVIMVVILMLLTAIPFSIAQSTTYTPHNRVKTPSKTETSEITITIHTLSGKEQRTINVPTSLLNNITKPPSCEEILSYCSPETKNYINTLINKDVTKLSRLTMPFSRLSTSQIERKSSLPSSKPTDDYFINYLCEVKGIGILLLFPPFLPITPILWAGLLILNTNGTMGEINQAVEQAVMMPFIGLSFWWVQAYFFVGYAGIAIGFSDNED